MSLLFFLFLISNTNDTLKTYIAEPIIVTAPLSWIYEKDYSEKEILEISDGLYESMLTIPSCDLLIRNPFGIQGDFSIRGATFKQTLTIIDGIPINDPQTAHLNQDIPVPLISLEKIFILEGISSGIWGPDALGGAVFFKTMGKINKNKIRISKGEYGFNSIEGILGYNFKKFNIYFAGENFYSDGFMKNRDFVKNNFLLKSEFKFEKGFLTLLSGYGNKKYGAENFYADFPSWETTNSSLTALNFLYIIGSLINNISLWTKFHRDSFVLIREKPEIYANRHNKETYGIRYSGILKNIKFGSEYVYDRIFSTRLGNRKRERLSFYTSYSRNFKNLLISPAIKIESYNIDKFVFLPYFSIFYSLNQNTGFSISYRESYRLPSFTELYYFAPSNRGDSLLNPENSRELELGFKKRFYLLTISLKGFYRKDFNLISWIKTYQDTIWFWKAQNISSREVYGSEILFYMIFKNLKIKFGYMREWFYSSPKDIETKYALRILKYKLSGHLMFRTDIFNIILSGFYRKRFNEEPSFIMNGKITYRILKKPDLKLGIRMFNILNSHYEDFPGVPYPPRWFQALFEINF